MYRKSNSLYIRHISCIDFIHNLLNGKFPPLIGLRPHHLINDPHCLSRHISKRYGDHLSIGDSEVGNKVPPQFNTNLVDQ